MIRVSAAIELFMLVPDEFGRALQLFHRHQRRLPLNRVFGDQRHLL